MITQQILTILGAYTGMIVVWLPVGLAWLKWKKSKRNNACMARLTFFRIQKPYRFFGLILIIGVLFLINVMVFGIPVENIKPYDWILSFLVSAFLGGFGGLTGVLLWYGRISLCQTGLTGLSFWGTPRFMKWTDIHDITISPSMYSYKITSSSDVLYIPLVIEKLDDFVFKINSYLPNIQIDNKIVTEEKLVENYYQRLNKLAPKIILISGLLIAISLLFILPPFKVLFLAMAAGFLLSFADGFLGIVKHNNIWLFWLVQIISVGGFVFFNQIALDQYYVYLGVTAINIDGFRFSLTFIQILGIPIFITHLLVILKKYKFLIIIVNHFSHASPTIF